MRTLLAASLLLALGACADPARNLYEGIQQNQEARRSPQERALNPAPSYDQYNKERNAESR